MCFFYDIFMWEIKGLGYLEFVSGKYKKEEALPVLVLALERAESLFDFDNLVEGRSDSGILLSGSQLLESIQN